MKDATISLPILLRIIAANDRLAIVMVGGTKLAMIKPSEEYGWDWFEPPSGDWDDEDLDALVVAIHDALGTSCQQRKNSSVIPRDVEALRPSWVNGKTLVEVFDAEARKNRT